MVSIAFCRVKDVDPECQAAAAKEFVQFCILPRLFLSPADALYCVEFLHRIHTLGPPGLRLLSVVDRLFRDLGYMVRCCTPKESTNLGIFFSDLMGLVAKWRQKKVYARDCAESEAFKSYKKKGVLEPVSFEEFIKLSANWHKTLTLNVFKSCIVSKDYMQMKNVLLVLNRMVRIYPATKEDAQELLDTLKPISETDPREDLKTLARMYCTGLEMSMRDRKMTATRHEYAGLPPPKRKSAEKMKVDVGIPGGSSSKTADKKSREVSIKITNSQAPDRNEKDASQRDQQVPIRRGRSFKDGNEKIEKKHGENDREQKTMTGKMDDRDNLKRKAGEDVHRSNWDRNQDRSGGQRARDRYSDDKEMSSKPGSRRETGRTHEEDRHAMERRENRDGRLRGHSTIVNVVSERRRSYGTSTDFQVDSRKQRQEKEQDRINQTSRLTSQRPQKEDRDSRRTAARDADKHPDQGIRSHKSARNIEPNRDETQRTRGQYSRRKHKRDEYGSSDNKSKRSKHDEAYADKTSTGRGHPTEKMYDPSRSEVEPPSRVRNRLKDPGDIVSAALRNSRDQGERHGRANRPNRNRNRS